MLCCFLISLWSRRHLGWKCRTPTDQREAEDWKQPVRSEKGFLVKPTGRGVPSAWLHLQKKTLISACHLWQSQEIPTLTDLCMWQMDSRYSFDNWTMKSNFTRTVNGIAVYASFWNSSKWAECSHRWRRKKLQCMRSTGVLLSRQGASLWQVATSNYKQQVGLIRWGLRLQ